MQLTNSKLIRPILALPNWLVWVFVTLFLFLGVMYLTSQQVNNVLVQERQILHHRTSSIAHYIKTCERITAAMADTVKNTYLNEVQAQSTPAALHYLRDYPKYNTFGISGFTKDGGIESLSATLTGQGSIARIDADLRNEIVAALALDGQIGTQTSNNSDFVWAYYTSAKRFVFLAPKVSVDDFQFTTDLYKKAYWTHAIPSANPNLRTIISPLYEDAGGKGLMITVSSPVVADKKFLGVGSIDIGIETLSDELSIDESIGETSLIGYAGNIIAKKAATKLGEHLNFDFDQHTEQLKKLRGGWWMFENIPNSEIRVVHWLDSSDVYLAAFKKTVIYWLFFLMMASLVCVLLKFKEALVSITDVAHVDQLSGLFNRRGFREGVASKNRVGVPWVVLILDIDHFKKTNDQFGHDAGDQIIAGLAKVLKNNIRTGDIAGRWGGEEFVIYLHRTRLKESIDLAEKYLTEISSQVKSPNQHPITVSIGVAEARSHETLDDVLERADRQLYIAKHTGRNCIAAED